MNKYVKYSVLVIIILLSTYYFWPEKNLEALDKIDKIIVVKHKREMTVYAKERALKIYKISLGKEPVGKKAYEGDKKTPEGTYRIVDKNPNSMYHLNLGISYPNEDDIKYASEKGKNPGGQIKIHGLRNGLGFIGKVHRGFDWTLGCIAVTNQEIEELYNNVSIGTEIEIRK